MIFVGEGRSVRQFGVAVWSASSSGMIRTAGRSDRRWARHQTVSAGPLSLFLSLSLSLSLCLPRITLSSPGQLGHIKYTIAVTGRREKHTSLYPEADCCSNHFQSTFVKRHKSRANRRRVKRKARPSGYRMLWQKVPPLKHVWKRSQSRFIDNYVAVSFTLKANWDWKILPTSVACSYKSVRNARWSATRLHSGGLWQKYERMFSTTIKYAAVECWKQISKRQASNAINTQNSECNHNRRYLRTSTFTLSSNKSGCAQCDESSLRTTFMGIVIMLIRRSY